MLQTIALKLYQPMSVAQMAAIAVYLKHVTLHWTAGNYTWTSPKYHLHVAYDEKTGKAYVVQTRSIRQVGEHVYKRNTGNIGLSLCGMGINPKTKKAYVIQQAQVQVAGETCAELVYLFGPKSTEDLRRGMALQLERIQDHAYWATIDGYGPGSGHRETRVDVAGYKKPIQEIAAKHLGKLLAGTAKVVHLAGIK